MKYIPLTLVIVAVALLGIYLTVPHKTEPTPQPAQENTELQQIPKTMTINHSNGKKTTLFCQEDFNLVDCPQDQLRCIGCQFSE